jgi:EVE domain
MPPKKRGRPLTKSAAAPERLAKRVRVGETSVIGTQDATETTSSGRAKRSTTNNVNYSATLSKAPSAKQAENEASAPTAKPAAKSAVPRKKKSASKLFTRPKRRSSLTAKAEPEAKEVAAPKRGRPKGLKTTATAQTSKTPSTSTATGRPRGRPKKEAKKVKQTKSAMGTKRKASNAEPEPTDAENEDVDEAMPNGTELADDGAETDASEPGRQYWLMKAEPESRIENGIDVKFSIDDLKASKGAEKWDGVRNFGARNNMRAMTAGDLAFLYHSNCKVPGIAGIMEIVGEHTVDGMFILLSI